MMIDESPIAASVEPGQLWRHFKGSVYEVICVTSSEHPPAPMPTVSGGSGKVQPLRLTYLLSCVHTETEKVIIIAGTKIGTEEKFWACEMHSQTALPSIVVYKKEGDKHPWGRPLDNFLQTLCNGKPVEPDKDYSSQTLHSRFTRVK